jgi:hypothetical protein
VDAGTPSGGAGMEERVGQRLVRIGAMTSGQVQEVLEKQRAGDGRLFGEIAIELGYVKDEALRSYLGIKATCPFQRDCHFFNIREMVASTLRLKELYCQGMPSRCAIFQARAIRKPVTITLWPTGKIAT